MQKKVFTVTDNHLKLLRSMWVGWDSGEFGAPAIDCKRPYGNSDVYGDISEILDIPEDDTEQMDKLHGEMKTVLQIMVRAGALNTGDYEAEQYDENWVARAAKK